MRMSSRGSFQIDHEMTRLEVTLIGAYRPLIGSVSGIVVYFLIKTPLIPLEESALTLPLFIVVAFLAGFESAGRGWCLRRDADDRPAGVGAGRGLTT